MWGKNAHHDQFFTFLTADLDPFKPGHPCGVLWIVVCRMGCVTRCLASCFSMPSGLHVAASVCHIRKITYRKIVTRMTVPQARAV
jgi:hypothetical protein